ncbi:MAG TPA: IniB N-terminal domain-containing protein, partial [Mycobacterium sp.]
MTNVIDWILDLFRDPVMAQAFVDDPDRSMANAGVQGVTAAQVNAVAATVAPAAVIHGGGNPVHGLQQAVAETHGIAFTPQYAPVWAPETQAFSNNDTLSHNDTLSNNDVLSPNAGHDVQQGGVNLDFGDITFGDKNTASDGSVINTGNAGDIDNTNVEGDGNVVGDDNDGNVTGDIETGNGSPVIIGDDNEVENTNQDTDGGDIIQDNDGPVVKTGD